MNKLFKSFLIVIVGTLFMLPMANAEPYIGLNYGTATHGNSSYDEAASAFIYAGVDLGHIAVEAGITPLGYYKHKTIDASLQYDGFEIDVLAKLYDVGFTPYAKLGYYDYTRKVKISGTSYPEVNGSTITYGVGIMADLGQTLQARIAYEIYDDVDSKQVTRVILGLAAKIF